MIRFMVVQGIITYHDRLAKNVLVMNNTDNNTRVTKSHFILDKKVFVNTNNAIDEDVLLRNRDERVSERVS